MKQSSWYELPIAVIWCDDAKPIKYERQISSYLVTKEKQSNMERVICVEFQPANNIMPTIFTIKCSNKEMIRACQLYNYIENNLFFAYLLNKNSSTIKQAS